MIYDRPLRFCPEGTFDGWKNDGEAGVFHVPEERIVGYFYKVSLKFTPMPNTYTQLHIQFVFAVKYRTSLINPEWQENLHQYITGIIQHNNHKMLQINSMPDHIHILIGMRPTQAISALVQNVKTENSKWINENNYCHLHFKWQEGFGAFSYSKSHVNNVIRYIQNQQAHHKRQTFLNEYRQLLKLFEVEYDEKYIFRELE